MRIIGALLLAVPIAAVAAACGSSDNSTFGNGGGGDGDGGFIDDAQFGGGPIDGAADPDAFFATDPPPKWCGPDASPAPPAPGGTPECPDDKNREGCPCTTVGQTAPCWPGLRANRNLGICHDGTTTCQSFGEFQKTWGPCQGYQLPVAGATKGKEACKCFSQGVWAIKNLVPCFITYSGSSGTSTWGVSTINGQCPTIPANSSPPPAKPAQPWSSDTLTVDCQGHFRLCYALKAGDYNNPQPTDCTVAQVCTEGDYPTKNVETPFPDLDSWVAQSSDCSKKFADVGGYGEMTVKGSSWACEDISDNGQPEVFHRVQYCPFACFQNPSAPECANCMQGGTGQF